MADYNAIPIKTIDGTLVTDDGMTMLLKVTQVTGEELNLAIPYGELHKLIDGAATSHTHGSNIQKIASQLKHYFPIQWWELGTIPDRSGFVLSLTLPNGGILSFALNHQMASGILETLQVQLGKPIAPAPEKPKH